MKLQVGTDIGAYSFNAAGKVVTMTGITTGTVTLDEVYAIIHAPSGNLLYQIGNTSFAAASYTPAANGGTLTLNASVSTSGMSNSDPLMILITVPESKVDTAASGSIVFGGNNTVQIATVDKGTAAFTVTGTWTGSIIVELFDGTNWNATTYVSLASGGIAQQFSANTSGQINTVGYQACRLRGNSITSGTANVIFTASDKVALTMLDNGLPTGSNNIGSINNITGSIPALATTNLATNHELWRDSFLTIDLTNNWQVYVGNSGVAPTLVGSPISVTTPHAGIVYQFTNGDILFADGNVLSGSYATLAKHPFNQNTDTWLINRTTVTGPVRILSGMSISQRIAANEMAMEQIGVDTNGAPVQDSTYTPVALTSIQVTSANQLNVVTTATPHGLLAGDRFMITGVKGPSSAVTMNIGPCVVTTVLSPTTFASVTAWVGLTLATGTYVGTTAAGTVVKLEPLSGAQFGFSTLWDGATAGNAWSISRDGTAGSTSQFIAWNPGNTQDTAVVPSPVFSFSQPYTYSFQPKGTFEMYGLRDYLAWSTVDIDSVAAVRSSINRSQNLPTPARNYRTRLRAKNLNAAAMIGRVVSTTKSASTTATVTTDVPHGLAVNDPILIFGQRDQTNFANQTTAVFVASVINTYQFTVVYGASATATSYGGYVVRGDNAAVSATLLNITAGAFQTMLITNSGRLRVTGSATFTNAVVGDTVFVTGLMDNSGAGANTPGTVAYGALDGFYRVALLSTTNLELEPLQGQVTTATQTGITSSSTFAGGSGYVQGTYTGVPLTGGTGSGAVATITVSAAGAVQLVNLTALGTGYVVGDTLSASNTNLGGSGSGFSFVVAQANNGPVAAITGIQAGSGYTNGTYSSVGTTGGSGTGLTVTVTVTGGLVAGAAGALGIVVSAAGTGYKPGDVITVPLANIGNTGTVAPTFVVYSVTENANYSGAYVKASALRAHFIRCLDMTMDVVESHSGSARSDANHANPVMVQNPTANPGAMRLSDGTTAVAVIASTTALKTDLSSVAGTATVNGGLAGTLGVGGAAAHSAATTTNPVTCGGRVLPTTIATIDLTLAANDSSFLPITTGYQLATKQFGTAEQDWGGVNSLTPTVWASASTPVQIRAASGTASVRTYISNLQVETDALGGATSLWIIDGAVSISSATVATPGVFTSGTHDFKVGDAVVLQGITGLTITGITANQVCYVATVPSTTTFTLATTQGGSGVQVTVTGTATIYRILKQIRLQAAALPLTPIQLSTPIRSAPNVAISLLCSATQTGTVYVDEQGYYGF